MKNDKKYLKLAIDQAKESIKLGGFPAGAVLVKDDKIISRGVSLGFKLNDPTSHAETSSISQACQKLKTTDLNGATLYASLQPCLMCFSVANWANVSRIVYAAVKTQAMVDKFYYEGKTDINKINEQNNHKIKLVFIPDFEKETVALVKKWEDALND
jgi:tRNA(Arg) A34 adenosine deaminase TadA